MTETPERVSRPSSGLEKVSSQGSRVAFPSTLESITVNGPMPLVVLVALLSWKMLVIVGDCVGEEEEEGLSWVSIAISPSGESNSQLLH